MTLAVAVMWNVRCEMGDVITIIFVSHSGTLDPPTNLECLTKPRELTMHKVEHMYNITTDLPLFT